MWITRFVPVTRRLLITKKIKDKKLRGNMQKLQQRFSEVAYHAQQTEMLLPEMSGYLEVDGMEKTYKITQQQLKSEVDITTANKVPSPSPDRGVYQDADGRALNSSWRSLVPMPLIIL